MSSLCCWGIATRVNARFSEDDANLISAEERYNTETYNDKASYRYPLAWQRLWSAKFTGMRVNAGSLNATRFDYQQDIKLSTGERQPFELAFFEQRQEDVIESLREREFRVGWALPQDIWLYALGDGGTYKEYGDIGAALAYKPDLAHSIEFYYWSVDHFYSTKKSDAEDQRPHRLWTVGNKIRWPVTSDVKAFAKFEYDRPLIWDRPSRGYIYEYARRQGTFQLSCQLPQSYLIQFDYLTEWKNEGKTWFSEQSSQQEKFMQRHFSSYGLSFTDSNNNRDLDSTFEYSERTAGYRQSGLENSSPESASPGFVARHELAWYTTIHQPISDSTKHFWQWGTHLNNVSLREDIKKNKKLEAKVQLAWDYAFTPTAKIFLNTSWDIDQLAYDFPYRTRPFRPWGGGNIQLIAVF